MAVKLENDDRRYVICDVNQKYKNDKRHFKPLYEMRTRTFYEHLLTFFMKRDISDYIPGEIPMTKNKKAIHFIREHHERFGADGWQLVKCISIVAFKPNGVYFWIFFYYGSLGVSIKCLKNNISY